MANLSNQQINQTFNGLLQVPGGIDSTLKTVQDGNGNPTGLQLSSTGANVTTSDTYVVSVSGTQITGAVPQLISDGFGAALNAADFGILGNGSDETTKIQAALNAASGKTLLFQAGKTYGYTQLTLKANATIFTFGSTFNRLAASTSAGFIVESGVSVDVLNITTPGGSSGEKGMVIKGSNVTFDRLSITAAAQGVYNSLNYALEIESSPIGSVLSNITIRSFYCKYFSAGIFAKYTNFLSVSNALIEYYRTGIYLRDASNCRFDNSVCRYTASTAYGAPGENGVLLEASINSGTSHDIYFTNCSMENSGEHGYRLGGTYAIKNVWFDNCSAIKPGSAIVVNNPAATEWHGGCGFKILGNTTVTGRKHTNIYYNNCLVEDINETYGTFPSGHSAGNFAGFHIGTASYVTVSNCVVRKYSNVNYSSSYGVELLASDHVYFENVQITDMYQTVRLFEQTPGVYPGWDLPYEYIYLKNCHFDTAFGDYVFEIGQANQNYNNHDIYMTQCHLSGGSHATRVWPITGTGSYAKVYFDFTYTDCTADPATAVEPICYGGGGNNLVVANVKGPWHPAAYSPQLGNGSFWQDTYQGQLYTRANGSWAHVLSDFQTQQIATAANLASIANAINTTHKTNGTLVFNTTDNKLYRAMGNATNSIWRSVDGVTTITPV